MPIGVEENDVSPSSRDESQNIDQRPTVEPGGPIVFEGIYDNQSLLGISPLLLNNRRPISENRPTLSKAGSETEDFSSDQEANYASEEVNPVQDTGDIKDLQREEVIPEQEQQWTQNGIMVAPRERSISATLLSTNTKAEQVISGHIPVIYTPMDSYFYIPVTVSKGHRGLFVIDKPFHAGISSVNDSKGKVHKSKLFLLVDM